MDGTTVEMAHKWKWKEEMCNKDYMCKPKNAETILTPVKQPHKYQYFQM